MDFRCSDVQHNIFDLLMVEFSVTEKELDRLKHALTLLSEAEKHLRVSSERTTCFTPTLLQLGSTSSPVRTQCTSKPREATAHKQNCVCAQHSGSSTSFMSADRCNSTINEKLVGLSQFIDGKSLTVSHGDCISRTCEDSEMLTNIWLLSIGKCHSMKLRLLLHSYGKLVSISEMKGGLIAHIAFENSNMKTRAEGFLKSITSSLEVVLRRNVEVKISLLQDSLDPKQMNRILGTTENRSTCLNATRVSSDLDLRRDSLKISRESFDMSRSHQEKGTESASGNASTSMEDSKSDLPMWRIESIIHKQGLETGCLQASDKGTPGSMSHSKPERNQLLPQDGVDDATNSPDVSTQPWEDELIHGMKTLKMKEGMTHQKDQIVMKINHCPISPSLLHNSTFANSFSKDNMGYESGGGGCSGMLCWINKRRKAKRGTPIHAAKRGRFSLFGGCAKSSRDSRR